MEKQILAVVTLSVLGITCPGVRGQPASEPPPSVWEPAAAPLPDSPAGRCAEAYVRAFNGGDEAVREFEVKFRSAAALKDRPLEARVRAYHDLKKEWGGLEPHSVLNAKGGGIVVLMKTVPAAQWLVAEFQFEPEGALKAISIEGPVGADEMRQRLAPLDDETREQTIKAVAYQLRKDYVFPEVAEKMGAALERNAADGKYAKITGAPELARTLTDDLRLVCHDKHLRIRLNDGGPGRSEPRDESRRNHGFVRAEILANNIGYVRLDGFSAGDEARATAAAAMAFVSHCDALIFDVRQNGGGSPRMVEFLGGYLFESPTILNTFRDRKGRQVSQTRTLAQVPGTRFSASLPVYVLISGRTFSCAEEFSYDLQTTGRATIVGETTGGGAHPVKGVPLNDRFAMMIPYERAENPITHTNWEGTGVEPDIRVPADAALDAALADATRRLTAGPR